MPKRSLPGTREFDRLNSAVEAMLAPASRGTGGAARRSIKKADSSLEPLLRVASALRDLPRQDFKASLKKNLERSASMATTEVTPTVRTFSSPRLAFKNAPKAMEFYKNAFGAKEIFRFENEHGFGHGEMAIGDSVIMFAGEWAEGGRYSAETLGQSPVSMSIQVPDVDAFVEHAVAAGATLKTPVSDQFYGYRDGVLLDPFGYSWTIYAVKEEMSVEEMLRRGREAMPPPKEPDVPPVPKGYR